MRAALQSEVSDFIALIVLVAFLCAGFTLLGAFAGAF